VLHLFFLFCWTLTMFVAFLPLAYFFAYGWPAREAEFIDKVTDDTPMSIYFKKFWAEGSEKYVLHNTAVGKSQRTLFRGRYRSLTGRSRYAAPLVLFVLIVGVLSGLVVTTALRSGYDNYIRYFANEAETEDAAVKKGVTIDNPITLQRIALPSLEANFLPFPPIQLSLSALSAIAGAYLFMVAQLIQQCRARTLVYSDLFGASLRLVIAVPLGLSVSLIASDALGPFISFGLGAFPIAELSALIRRLTTTSLKAGDPRANDDQTVLMLGVTQSVSDVLAAENITCAQQLADIDPVVLAVRTGLSFDYVLFLAAQSLVWCFLGKTASDLGPLGLGDCRAIWYLMQKQDSDRKAVFESAEKHFAAKAGPNTAPAIDATLLGLAFEKIAADPYTAFLVDFTSGHKTTASQ
jgi:hypothetical protein